MKSMFKSKKIIILITIIICLLLLGIGIFLFINKDLKERINDLEIVYFGRDKVKIKKIDDDFVYEKEIIIKNTSNELRTYSLEWSEIENNFKNQSGLLYIVSSEGERAARLEKSQLPSSESIIFPQVAILPGKSHTYKIKVWYEGENNKEVDSIFLGRLKVNSNLPEISV